ncbi:hypothetical protein OVN18_02950 [Microcella daejeonensis]|uniref:Uncharacterized protein n=1 Tax=Microcella daejeonensis TaxID=2994971 RepID=A0A9E8MNI0_9MICO|nr:hypothetical protein [Microcella daejeonensis]WAB81991.1 hypothetical protein OVN18_02950 [Microcella daejeonensis]
MSSLLSLSGRTSPARQLQWLSPQKGLWVASEHTAEGMAHAGYVELVGTGYVVADGVGRHLGRFATRAAAQRALRTSRLRRRDQRASA